MKRLVLPACLAVGLIGLGARAEAGLVVPPIEPGDVFLCNDPYSGSVHQNCVTLVGPIHHRDRLVAWCGATLHVVDVGGATVGQVGIGARSILDEAPVTPPTIRISANSASTR